MSKLKDELDKLSSIIVGKNALQSPLDFWARYDTWREAVKGLEQEIKRMEENDGNTGEDSGRDRAIQKVGFGQR